MTARRYFILVIAAVLFLIGSCDEQKQRPDYSNVPIETKFLHLESDIQKLNKNAPENSYDILKSLYGEFFDIYTQSVLGLGKSSDSGFLQSLSLFLKDTSVQIVFSAIETNFASTATIDAEILHGLQGLNQNLPDMISPNIVYLMSGLRYNVVLSDSVLGIGLDLYLGQESNVYERAGVPLFRRDNSEPNRIPYDALRSWLISEIEMSDYQLVDHIVQYGKVMAILEELYPDVSEEYLAGYTSSEWKWCVDNEALIWAKLIESKTLFSNKAEDVRKYTADGPFTAGFPRESPSRLAVFVGWQIMRSFLDRNDVTLSELVAIKGSEILNKSNYKPE